eukprot:1676888-Amphidinium_carterae.1
MIDRNHDGVITRSELTAAFAAPVRYRGKQCRNPSPWLVLEHDMTQKYKLIYPRVILVFVLAGMTAAANANGLLGIHQTIGKDLHLERYIRGRATEA